MKLSIKEINRSQAIYKELCKLDEEIIKLDKRALQLTESTKPVDLRFTFKENIKTKVLDEDGSLANDFEQLNMKMMKMMSLPSFLMGGEMTSKNTDFMNVTLSDTEALSIIGFIINLKKSKRDWLINELKELGFEIN